MDHQENTSFEGVDLMEYILISWRNRWRILIVMAAFAVVAGVLTFFMPKIWRVEAIISPSRFIIQNEIGEFREILAVAPKQLASQIKEGSFNALIAAEMNMELRTFPRIDAENIRDTNLVRISLRVNLPENGRSILLKLFNHVKSNLDRTIDVEINSMDTIIERYKNEILNFGNEIKTHENGIEKKNNEIRLKELEIESRKIEKDKIEKEIEFDKNKFKIVENRIAEIQEEIKSIKSRIDELDKQQRQYLTEEKEGTETLALLLYSNEVQRNLQYYNTLNERVSAERLNIENILNSINQKEQSLRQIDNQVSQIKTTADTVRAEIDTIKNDIRKIQNAISSKNSDIKLVQDKKNRINYAQMVKDPTPSVGPVSPKRKRIVLIAFLLGFGFSVGAAILNESIKKRKGKGIAKS